MDFESFYRLSGGNNFDEFKKYYDKIIANKLEFNKNIVIRNAIRNKNIKIIELLKNETKIIEENISLFCNRHYYSFFMDVLSITNINPDYSSLFKYSCKNGDIDFFEFLFDKNIIIKFDYIISCENFEIFTKLISKYNLNKNEVEQLICKYLEHNEYNYIDYLKLKNLTNNDVIFNCIYTKVGIHKVTCEFIEKYLDFYNLEKLVSGVTFKPTYKMILVFINKFK
jgi:hypothetical protein